MVPPVMNRVRGKSKEARIRDHKRMNKGNLKAAGKTKLKVLSTPESRGGGAADHVLQLQTTPHSREFHHHVCNEFLIPWPIHPMLCKA